MPVYLGTTNISNIRVGSTAASKVYVGVSQVWSSAPTDPLSVLVEPFDSLSAWTNTGGSLVAGRTGNGVAVVDTSRLDYTIPAPSVSPYNTVGVAFRTDSLASQQEILGLYLGGVAQTRLELTTAGVLTITRGSTSVQSSASATITAGPWYYIEMQTFSHDSTGTVSARVGGVQVISATGLDTRNTGDPTELRLASVTATTHTYDDLYLRTGVSATFKGDYNPPAVTRPSLVGTASVFPGLNTAATSTTIAIPTPAGAAIGEGLLACLTSSGASASDVTLPGGWSRIGLAAINDANVRVLGWFYLHLTGTPAASYSFTAPAAGRFGGMMWRVQNAHATQPHKAGHAYGPRVGASATIYDLTGAGGNAPTDDALYLVAVNEQVSAGQAGTYTAGPVGATASTTTEYGTTAGSRTALHTWYQNVSPGPLPARTVTFSVTPSSAASNAVVLRKA